MADLPAELAHLSWLIGEWEGFGLGQYPTIEDFRFQQRVSISNDGRSFLHYRSHSQVLDSDGSVIRPGASESGYLRPRPGNGVEFLLSHPTGFVEIWVGIVTVTSIQDARIDGARMELATDLVARTESAKPYTGGQRLYGLVKGDLLWSFDMAAMGEPLGNHLAATLRPVGP